MNPQVVIVGGGLSGLACATRLYQAKVPFLLLEQNSFVGGRATSVKERGYIFDRGFQVYLNDYQAGKEILDYESLELEPFDAGAYCRFDEKFHFFGDPLRELSRSLSTLRSGVATPADLIRLGTLRLKHQLQPFARPPTPPFSHDQCCPCVSCAVPSFQTVRATGSRSTPRTHASAASHRL